VLARIGSAVSPEREEAPVVGVSHLGRESVGTRVVAHEVEHPINPCPLRGADRPGHYALGGVGAPQEQLGDQAVIRDRRLVVTAIRPHLVLELPGELRGGEACPCVTLAPGAEQSGDDQQADHV
jgi:hypothetical protein